MLQWEIARLNGGVIVQKAVAIRRNLMKKILFV